MKRRIADARAIGLRACTTNPFSPSTTVSRQPGTSVVIMGRAVAIASKMLGNILAIIRRKDKYRAFCKVGRTFSGLAEVVNYTFRHPPLHLDARDGHRDWDPSDRAAKTWLRDAKPSTNVQLRRIQQFPSRAATERSANRPERYPVQPTRHTDEVDARSPRHRDDALGVYHSTNIAGVRLVVHEHTADTAQSDPVHPCDEPTHQAEARIAE